jgi:hypothetical protein
MNERCEKYIHGRLHGQRNVKVSWTVN